MKLTELDMEFVRSFFDILHDTQKGIHDHPDFNYSRNNFDLLSERGQYAQRVFNYYQRANEVQDDLSKVEIFLRRFPLKKFYEENDIDYLSYSKYHTEVFYHKINTMLDLLKLMVNEVFELGLSPRKCTWDSLNKKAVVKDSPSLNVIKYFHKSFEHIVNARNLNTHRGIYNDSESDDIRVPMMIYKNSEKFDIEVGEDLKMAMPKFIIEYRLKKFKKEKIDYIKNGNEVATQYFNLFMHVTLPEVIRIASLKSHE